MVGIKKTVTINRKVREWSKKRSNKQTLKVRKDWKLDTWRPTKKTDGVLEKLKTALMRNCTEAEACSYAWIDQSTLIDWKKQDPKFSKRVDDCKNLYKQAIKFASYERALNTKNRDSTDILFKIDPTYQDTKEIKHSWTVSLVHLARLTQEKRLENEKNVIPMDTEEEKPDLYINEE